MILSKSFYNKKYKCSEYSERNTYIKTIESFFNKLLNDYAKDDSTPFIKVFSEYYNNKFRGKKQVEDIDIEEFNTYCLKCAETLDILLVNYPIEIIQHKFYYKKLTFSFNVKIQNKDILIYFSYKNIKETEKDIDFYVFNNYIYNQTHKTHYDCLILSVPTNCCFYIKNNNYDYTTKKGFFNEVYFSRIKKPGEYCNTCSKSCKPTFTNGVSRLSYLI